MTRYPHVLFALIPPPLTGFTPSHCPFSFPLVHSLSQPLITQSSHLPRWPLTSFPLLNSSTFLQCHSSIPIFSFCPFSAPICPSSSVRYIFPSRLSIFISTLLTSAILIKTLLSITPISDIPLFKLMYIYIINLLHHHLPLIHFYSFHCLPFSPTRLAAVTWVSSYSGCVQDLFVRNYRGNAAFSFSVAKHQGHTQFKSEPPKHNKPCLSWRKDTKRFFP